MIGYEPISLALEGTVSTETSAYPDYTSQLYYRGDRVYNNPANGGDGLNYEMTWHTFTATSRPDEYPWPWEVVEGPLPVSYTSFTTDAAVSLNDEWVSGDEISEGERRYDVYDRNDYEAVVEISTSDNTVRPSSAVQSGNVDIAARWVRVAPANAFACLDDRVSTRTKATGEWSMTIIGTGRADNIALFGLRNAASVQVVVSAGELMADEDFVSAGLQGWAITNGSLSHNNPGLQITNSGGTAEASYVLSGLTPGVSYTIGTNASGTSWRLFQRDYNGANATTGTTNSGGVFDSLTFTAVTSQHTVGLQSFSGNDLSCSLFSAFQASYTQETTTKDLAHGSGTRYKRRVRIPHTVVTAPKYEITLTGPDGEDVAVGLISAGYAAIELGSTEASVEVGGRQYHEIREDEFGGVRFLERAVSRDVNVTVWLDDDAADGDEVNDIITDLSGKPVTWDFNSSTTDDSRLLVHGWPENWRTDVTGLPGNDRLVIRPMRGLAE